MPRQRGASTGAGSASAARHPRRNAPRPGESRAVHVCTVSELVRSLVERRGLTEREATELVARALREDPQRLVGRQRVPTETRIRIEQLSSAH